MRESRSSGSVEGVVGNHDSYSDSGSGPFITSRPGPRGAKDGCQGRAQHARRVCLAASRPSGIKRASMSGPGAGRSHPGLGIRRAPSPSTATSAAEDGVHRDGRSGLGADRSRSTERGLVLPERIFLKGPPAGGSAIRLRAGGPRGFQEGKASPSGSGRATAKLPTSGGAPTRGTERPRKCGYSGSSPAQSRPRSPG
jgi:hypothetical protein